jgi:class III poly(R)-hydroxyalkanoic acid synthase PhaE subunit
MEKQSTSWGAISEELMSSWTEMGTQMWKSWFDLMGTATREPTETVNTELTSIAQRFFDNQQLLLRLLKLSFNTWQDFFPKATAGGDWQQFLQNYSEQIRSQFERFSTGNLKVTQDLTELWQLYLREFQGFSQLWLTALGSSITPWSKTISGKSEPWIELNNLYWNLLYEESFGSLMQSPLLGPTREFNGKLLRTFDAWVDLYRASIDYQTLLTDIQIRSFEELMRQLVTLAEKGESVKDWRQFQQLWGRVADEVFEKAFCSENNLKVRGRFLNALNTYRIYQQDLTELWLKLLNLPSRTEVDEVHKNIYELRKEVKALKKNLAKYEALEQAITKDRTLGETTMGDTGNMGEHTDPVSQ